MRSNYGVEGVPIREQIVQRDGDVIITRNSYGALCLNSPDVLFADIDHAQPPTGCVIPAIVAAIVLLAGAVIGTLLWHWLVGLVLGVAAVLLVNATLLMRRKQRLAAAGGAEGLALKRVDAFSEQHPDWHLRAYRTPAGLRMLAMHATFSPEDEQLQAFFKALGTDTLYARMCRLQHCFRARLTPKPWRVGLKYRIRRRWPRGQPNRPTIRIDWPGLPSTKRRVPALPRAPTCAASAIPPGCMPRPSMCASCTIGCRTRRTGYRWPERNERSVHALHERLPCQGSAQPHRDLLTFLSKVVAHCLAPFGIRLPESPRVTRARPGPDSPATLPHP